MNNGNEFSDEQIDDLLRQVDVPADLKSHLLQIPHSQVNTALPDANETRRHFHNPNRWLVLAGIVATISAFFAWHVVWDNSGSDAENRLSDVSPSPEGESVNDSDAPLSDLNKRSVVSVASVHSAIDEIHAEIELMQLRAKVARLNLEASKNVVLAPREYESMIVAYADQAALNYGASPERVAHDMVNVIDRFPNSRGAAIAQQFLNKQNH